jgi:hypothetical protein
MIRRPQCGDARATRQCVLIALLLGMAWPAHASAAAEPRTPSDGAVLHDDTPTFTWALPDYEESAYVAIATSPDVSFDGSFLQFDIVEETYFPRSTRESWTVSTINKLDAGEYWWIVGTRDKTTLETLYSEPFGFTIPADLRLERFRVSRYRVLGRLSMFVSFRSFAAESAVRVELREGRRIVWRDDSTKRRDDNILHGPFHSASFKWKRPPNIKSRTRLKLTLTLESLDERVVRTSHVLAP